MPGPVVPHKSEDFSLAHERSAASSRVPFAFEVSVPLGNQTSYADGTVDVPTKGQRSLANRCTGMCFACCSSRICGCIGWILMITFIILLRATSMRFPNIGIQIAPLPGIYHGLAAHYTPDLVDDVKEKTIWLYWDNPDKMPDFIKVCIESIELHKGSFEIRMLSKHDIANYVGPSELPLHWDKLRPAQQKDALMNALLARYGGVALDTSMVMFRPLDDLWDEMHAKQAKFIGYIYWGPGSIMPQIGVYFLMAPRGDLFRSVVAAQVIGMGDQVDTSHYANPSDIGSLNRMASYLAMGHGVITPVFAMYDTSLRSFVGPGLSKTEGYCFPPIGNDASSGANKLILLDPMSGKYALQMNWCGNECPRQNVGANEAHWKEFLARFHSGLPFVKMFATGGSAKTLSRSQLLNQKDSFFFQWLCLAQMKNIGCPSEL